MRRFSRWMTPRSELRRRAARGAHGERPVRTLVVRGMVGARRSAAFALYLGHNRAIDDLGLFFF